MDREALGAWSGEGNEKEVNQIIFDIYLLLLRSHLYTCPYKPLKCTFPPRKEQVWAPAMHCFLKLPAISASQGMAWQLPDEWLSWLQSAYF